MLISGARQIGERQGSFAMKRNITLEEISDGRLYDENDMVKAGCNDCKGCSSCCCEMGDSIILDPFDICRLSAGLHKSFQELLDAHVELGVVDGVILPHLKMTGEDEKCSFLNNEGRCSIHPYRPGICRLFPLGRYYENGKFRYFLQTNECKNISRTKVKVSKWIDTPDLRKNREFVTAWHYFLNDCEEMLQENEDDTFRKNLNLYILNLFFIRPYETEADFYLQFSRRLERAKDDLGLQEEVDL